MIRETYSSARASPPAYLWLDPRSIHIYWSLVWTGADTHTLAADGPLSWRSITGATLGDLRRSHRAQHKRKPRDLGGTVLRELRHHNPNVRLNSRDERVERCVFLMMGWEGWKEPRSWCSSSLRRHTAGEECASDGKSERAGNERSCHEGGREGGRAGSILHRNLFPSSTFYHSSSLPSAATLPLHITAQ